MADFLDTTEIREALQNNNQALAVDKIKKLLERAANTPLNIGITGESGSGKSSFVNAFRGVDHRDDQAAPTDVVETTTEVRAYPHPSYPNVTLWDLPGIGTTRFPADQYLKHVGFERFDFFIIISDSRFRENDVKLAKEIQKMGEKFYFVRSKVDNDLQNAQRSQRNFDAEQTLALIRENCKEGLLKEGVQAPQVFLLSNFELRRHDFHRLHATLERELPEHKRDALLFAMPNMSLEIIEKKKEAFKSKIPHYAFVSAACAAVIMADSLDTTEIKEALQNNNQALAVDKIKKLLERAANTPLNIGITGESGSGKSSFVNAFRGVDHRDDQAAPTGVVETTTEVRAYPHPSYPNVTLWDLPGIGTTRFPADQYLKHVGFERFDFFIIISDTRFRENDVKLAKEIQKIGKKFYFVRSKVDNDLQNAQRSQRNFDAEQTLTLICENCEEGLLKEGVQAPQVFLLSNFELRRHDFHRLHATLERELPEHKRDALLLPCPT
ncbi:T-cell-specific guanine nucleotide triphosphate-binding protein 1 [Takifugu flavidus]|uniref:T-cell-specific guanine nucleotide triphosphate-binding protein 1 n=1 Tax=Takifugu flavidus TaxID=433684 RepID=A0A5C6NVN4_9TELE|nr:T-cell-specific guanine nucleotide triphosphate-binding protein 1 [Takifugu flavidus]